MFGKSFLFLSQPRRAIIKKKRAKTTFLGPKLDLPTIGDDQTIAALSRVYVREGLDEFQRWHEKCGHISPRYLKRLGVKTLSKLPYKIRCEECMRGKIHKFAHKELHTLEKEKYHQENASTQTSRVHMRVVYSRTVRAAV